MTDSALKTLKIIAQTVYDKKGFNILALNVKEISTMTDFTLIAEGNVDRHLIGIANAIEDSLLFLGEKASHIDGKGSDWIVIDYSDVIVHLLTTDAREKYDLEKLWQQADIVDVQIQV